MADTKITALAAITTVDPAADVLPIVDISDTSMAASGTTKKITTNQLTSTLVADAANDRVGIGTATPAAKLIVRDGTNRNLLVSSDATQLGSAGIAIGGFTDGAAGYAPLSLIASAMQFGIGGSTAMTLNSTGLGVGKSPSYKLDIAGVGNFEQVRVSNTAATNVALVNTTSGLTYTVYSANTASNGFNGFGIFDGSSYVLKIDSSGTATLASATITGDLTVDTNTLFVDSTNNRVGVLIASPQYNLHASQLVCASDPTTNGSAGRIYGAFLNAVGEPGLDLRRWNGGGGNSHGTTFIQTNLSGDTLFYNGIQASNTRATSLKATLLANGKLLVGTASEVGPGGILQISAGITFPATQVASSDANTLDDYEEGTFTPTVTGSGLTGITYTTQSGVYTKVGRMVTFAIQIAVSASTRAAAIFQIGSLPFTASGSNAYGALISYTDSGFFATAGANKPNLLVSSTDVVFYKSDGTSFNGTDIAANAFNVRITGTYFTT